MFLSLQLILTISLLIISIIFSVIVRLNFNSIELTRPTLTLGLGKFSSLTKWDERRMRIECST